MACYLSVRRSAHNTVKTSQSDMQQCGNADRKSIALACYCRSIPFTAGTPWYGDQYYILGTGAHSSDAGGAKTATFVIYTMSQKKRHIHTYIHTYVSLVVLRLR